MPESPKDRSTMPERNAGSVSAANSGFPRGPEAPRNAPNILLIMTDDVGFGASSTFGGPIPTPTFDALAQDGARFSAFHTTGVCSPTRAALLTGRNPHRVGMGYLPEMAMPEEGYTSVIPRSAASIARVMQLNGYSTAAFGKWHVCPVWEIVPTASASHVPNQMGFDHFYGFLGALTNPWHPEIVENGTRVYPDAQDRSYFLERDQSDRAIQWLRMQRLLNSDKPFFLYYATATLHAPLGAPGDWIARFRGKFDQGWDVLRTQIFEQQKRLGVIPEHATLTPMSEGTPKWDSLSTDEKRVAARHMEVYAAMLAYADHQIGRVIEELKRNGEYERTLIIYIQGDNGASPEGGEKGLFNYHLSNSGMPESVADNLARIEQMGGATGPTAVPVGWARATDAPFPWNKGIASHLGATRNAMVLSWPGHIKSPRTVRYQFAHVNDIAPTIYEAVGISPPEEVDGVRQMSFDGVSLLYALQDPESPTRHREQYFEVCGNMGLYKSGWLLASTPVVVKGGHSLKMPEDVKVRWELYDLRNDYSQSKDIAASEPKKLEEMIRRFEEIADENHVKPIRRDSFGRVFGVDRGLAMQRRGRFTLFRSPAQYDRLSFPKLNNRSWTAEAEIIVPENGGDGMIVAQGGQFAGWGLMILKGAPTFIYRPNDLDRNVSRIIADEPLTAGRHGIGIRFTADKEEGWGTGGVFTLMVDGKAVGQHRVEKTLAAGWTGNGVIGFDAGTPLTSDYQLPFRYPGEIGQVILDTREPVAVSSDK